MHEKSGNLIVISGLASCGKGRFIQDLSARINAYYVPSAYYYAARALPLTYFNSPDIESKQEYYAELDRKISQIAQHALKDNRFVVQDCNYVSSLAYDYAMYKKSGDGKTFRRIVEKYIKALDNLDLAVPDIYVFLDVPTSVRKQRSFFETLPSSDIHYDEVFSENVKSVHSLFMKVTNSIKIDQMAVKGYDKIYSDINAILAKGKQDSKSSSENLLKFFNSLL